MQELGLVDAFGASLEKKPTLSVGDDQAKWKAEKLAKEAADKQVIRPTHKFEKQARRLQGAMVCEIPKFAARAQAASTPPP